MPSSFDAALLAPTMLLSVLLRILGLATICCAATIQPFLRLDHNETSRYIPPGLEETLSFFPVDPRFSMDFYTLNYDISDKSMYMTGLRAMRELSRLSFDSLIDGLKWSNPQYGDVEIAVLGTNAHLEAGHAMWSIFETMLTMGRDQFRAIQGVMHWTEPGQPRKEIGRLLVIKSSALVSGRVGPPKNGTHQASKDARDTLIRRVAVSTLLEAESNVTNTSKNDTTSLKVPRPRNLRVEFEGPTLNKLGVFICIYGGIIGAASAPRPLVDFDQAMLKDDRTHVELDFKLWPDPQHRTSPTLKADDIVFMLCSIPRYMYSNNKFREGQFVLLVDDVPLLEGSMRRLR